MATARYSVDTSALIDGLERFYPAATFPGLWDAVDSLVAEQRFLASAEVWEEVKKKDEVVKEWVDPRRANMIIPTTAEVAIQVQQILGRFEHLVKGGGSRNRADAFVVAVARMQNLTVVTGEGADGNERNPKIPYVCAKLGIPCINFTEFIAAEGWRFQLVR